jgi:hypothetical protein
MTTFEKRIVFYYFIIDNTPIRFTAELYKQFREGTLLVGNAIEDKLDVGGKVVSGVMRGSEVR